MLTNETVQLNLVINGNKAKKELGDLDKEAIRLSNEMKNLRRGTKEWIDANKQLTEVKKKQEALRKEIGLTALSIKELNRESVRLRTIKNNLTPGTKEFKNIDAQLTKVNARISELRSSSKSAGLSIGKMADGFNKYFGLIASLAAGLTGMVLSFRKVIGVAQDFEKSMANVFTLLSENDLKRYGEELKQGSLQIIKEYGFEIQNTNKALFDAISAGVDASEANEFMNQSARLAIGGVTDLSTSTDGLTTILNAYKLEASETSKVADAFFSAQKEGKTTVAELAANIGKLAPIAANAGVGYQELLSATAELTKSGISTSESVTYMKSALQSLIKPSKEAQEVLEKYNVPMGLSQIKAAGFTETIARLNEVIQKNPDEIAKAIPSTEGLTAVMALSGEGFEDYRRILNNVNTDIGTTSSLSRAFATQQDTDSQKLARAKGELAAMSAEFGKKLTPLLVLSTNLFNKLLRFIVDNETAIKNLGKTIGVAATTIIGYHTALKAVTIGEKVGAAAKKAYSTAVAIATGKMKLFNAVSRANIIGAITSAVVAAITAFALFKDKIVGVTKEQQRFSDAQKQITSRLHEEQAQLQILETQINKTKEGTEERRKAIERINQQYGQYLPHLLTEKSSNEDIAKALKRVNAELERKITLEIYQEKLKEVKREELDLQEELLELKKADQHFTENMSAIQRKALEAATAGQFNYTKKVKETEDQLKRTTAEVQKYVNLIGDNSLIPENETQTVNQVQVVTTTGGTGDNSPKDSKEYKEKESILNEIGKLEEDFRIKQLDKNQQEIKRIEQKYAAMLEKVKAGTDEESRLLELQSEEIKSFQEQQIEEAKEKRREVLKSYGLVIEPDERRAALDELELHYQEKLLKDEEYREIRKQLEEEWRIEDEMEKAELDILQAETEQMEFDARMLKLKLQYDQEVKLANDNALKKAQAEKKYNDEVAKLSRKRIDAEKENFLAEKNIQLARIQTYGKATELIKALFKEHTAAYKIALVAEKAIAIADIWVNTAKANAQIYAEALTMYAGSGPAAPGLAAAWSAAPIASNKTNAILQTGIIAAQTVSQFAKGRYSVKGKDDGKIYSNVPYIGAVKESGIINGPALVSDQGDEMIITGPHTRYLQANYPEIIDAIYSTRVRQFADGKYVAPQPSNSAQPLNQEENNGSQISAAILMLIATTEKLSGKLDNLWAKVSYDSYKEAEEEMNKITTDVTFK